VRRAAAELAEKTRAWWAAAGYQVLGLAGATAATVEAGQLEVAISLGGDGTMLRTVELACPLGAPVLGVNLGEMGYLTEVEPEGLEKAFERFVAGDYEVAERMTLEVRMSGRSELVALNEAAIEKAVPGRTVRLEVEIGGRRFTSYVGDGVIVSTPTGSTAYNLSARGPIVSPSLRAMVLTPISPHMLFDRSLVLDPDEWVTVRLESETTAVVVVDGIVERELRRGDEVQVRAAAHPARIVTFGQRDFHSILRNKFGLSDR
jgi:NAD+ kinase